MKGIPTKISYEFLVSPKELIYMTAYLNFTLNVPLLLQFFCTHVLQSSIHSSFSHHFI